MIEQSSRLAINLRNNDQNLWMALDLTVWLEADEVCLLVMTRARADGREELVGRGRVPRDG